jgi:ATP-dependent Clp protease protease subunit
MNPFAFMGFFFTLTLIASTGTVFAGVDAPVPAPDATEMQRHRDQLLLENQIADEALRRDLAGAAAESARLKSDAELQRARLDRDLMLKRAEIEKARVEMEDLSARLALETARKQAETQAELAELRAVKERADLEANVALAEYNKRNNAFKAEEVTWNAKLAELRAKVAQREKETEANSYAEQRPIYLKDPLTADGELILSDRRIALNGLITMATADFVSARIDYFNNKTKEFPIFIVIDDSPGGSVMAGYKILKSMQSSSAPVYVVVKSFAASMAAAICTLAPRSFAYPNAIILHHQISNGMMGNLTVQREGLKMLEQWWQRLAAPIAAKMGISVDDFIKQMYAHTTTGDWKEFADEAVKLKWVDTVIGRCHETAWVKNPDADQNPAAQVATSAVAVPATKMVSAMTERADEKGHLFMKLPRLNPVDCYYLYNPDNYFRGE